MKKHIFIAGLLLPSLLFGQFDRSVKPEPAKAPIINIKDSEVFTTTNGITVILSENHKLPKVAFNFVMGADPMLEGNKAGLSELAGSLILSGTLNRTKDQLDNEKDYIGATLDGSERSLYLSCLIKHIDKGLSLMSDVLFNANFPESEFERVKKKRESDLLSSKSEPGVMADNAERRVNFPNHPFGEIMTEASLAAITREDVISYYKSTFTPKGSYLVVVGDVTREQLTALIEKYFSSWTGAEPYKIATNNGKLPTENHVFFIKKPGAVQSVIQLSFPMNIRTGDANQLPLNVLNGILGGGGFGTRLFQNLRESKAYTYGCYSTNNITEDGSWLSISGNFRNEVTDSAITQLLIELNRISTEKVTDDELNLVKSSMAGSFARSLERPQTIAQFALNIIKNKLNKDYYQTYLKRLDAVTKEDLLVMAKTYYTTKNCNIVVVGNEEIAEKLKQFDADGKIEYLDAFGNPEKEVKKADISKEVLIEKYLLAVTQTTSMKDAQAKLKKVSSYIEVQDVTIPQAPFPLKSTKVWVAPNQEGFKMEGKGMVFQKEYFDGTKGGRSSMQEGNKALTPEEIATKLKVVGLFPELNYATTGIAYEITGIENIDGNDAYVLKKNDGQEESFDYFDAKTFLKIKTVSIKKVGDEVVESAISYKKYQDVGGFLFPHSSNISTNEMSLEMVVSSIKLNEKIDLGAFK